MPTYKNLAGANMQTVQQAVVKAGLLLTNAKAKLATRDSKITSLLGDAFGIGPSQWSDGTAKIGVMNITNVLTKIASCMAKSTILFEPRPPANASQFACYVIVSTPRPEVFLTKLFFGGYSTVERAAYLAHEYVHLAHWPHGHPGVAGEQLAVFFERAPLGIPASLSVNNAYCYQYFVEWFAADYP